MTETNRSKIPVDDRDRDDVTDADWSLDDRPDRHFECIAGNPAAQEALNVALAQIREH